MPTAATGCNSAREQILSDKSSIEMMAFFDTVSGHGVGLLAIPVETESSEPLLRNEELAGRYARAPRGLSPAASTAL